MERLSTGFTCGELGSQEDDEGKDATLGGHLTTTTASPTNPQLKICHRRLFLHVLI